MVSAIFPLALHFLLFIFSSYFVCKNLTFYPFFKLVVKNKFLHLLHSSLFGHLFLSCGFLFTNNLLGILTESEFSDYYEKALSVITDMTMLASMTSQELCLRHVGSFCLLYAFKSFTWTLDIKAQKQANRKMVMGSCFVIILALSIHRYFYQFSTLVSYLLCMEYSLIIVNVLKNQLIMFLDIQKVETKRSLYTFIITIGYLSVKSIIFTIFILQFSKKARLPYGTLKSLIATIAKLYKKVNLFRKYLKLVKDLDSIEEVEVEGTCAICTDDLVKGKKLACSHAFHASCLKMWCEREVSCPICRSELIFRKEEVHETSEEILMGMPIEVEDE